VLFLLAAADMVVATMAADITAADIMPAVGITPEVDIMRRATVVNIMPEVTPGNITQRVITPVNIIRAPQDIIMATINMPEIITGTKTPGTATTITGTIIGTTVIGAAGAPIRRAGVADTAVDMEPDTATDMATLDMATALALGSA
jgi:hypothetical protein